MKTFRVRVWHGVSEHRIVVKARNAEEAMEQALALLKLSHKDVQRMESVAQ